MRSCQRTQHQPFYGCLPLEANWKGEKLDKWVPHELTTDQRRKSSFWSVVACYSTQHQWTTSQLVCDMQWKVDFIRQPAVMSSVAGSRRSSKSPPKAKLAPKKRSQSLFGGLLPIQSTTAFWTPAKPLYLRSTLRKSMRCTESCQQNGPSSSPWQHQPHVTQPMLQKLNYQVLTHPPYSPDHLPANCHFFNHLNNLLQGKIFPHLRWKADQRDCPTDAIRQINSHNLLI